MGKVGWDKVFIERLWRSFKYACVYLNPFENGGQARKQISACLRHYNQTRPNSTFNGQTHDEDYNKETHYQGHAPDNNIRVA